VYAMQNLNNLKKGEALAPEAMNTFVPDNGQ
jgi:hypothetical protein